MTWAQPIIDLRNKLSDGDTDKFFYRKKCFGQVDGSNTNFKTFEFRRITNFVGVASPLGVYVNGVNVSVTSDNIQTGDFTLAVAPAQRTSVEASYYAQWFLDSELVIFLRAASNWLAQGDTYSNIAGGLIPAALSYAQAEAYEKLALRWANHLSESFLLNDAPKEGTKTPADQYQKFAKQCRDDAYKSRDDYYSRSGQSNQPLYGVAGGTPIDPMPMR